MSDTELKPCPFCGETPVLKAVGRDWVRLTTTCDEACLLHNKEFDYSLSEENRQLLIDDWIRRAPQDNWIPITDTNSLVDLKMYIVQMYSGHVCQARFVKNGGVFDLLDSGNLVDFVDVDYYQPLPEPRK